MGGLGSSHVRGGAGIREMRGMRGGASASVWNSGVEPNVGEGGGAGINRTFGWRVHVDLRDGGGAGRGWGEAVGPTSGGDERGLNTRRGNEGWGFNHARDGGLVKQ